MGRSVPGEQETLQLHRVCVGGQLLWCAFVGRRLFLLLSAFLTELGLKIYEVPLPTFSCLLVSSLLRPLC